MPKEDTPEQNPETAAGSETAKKPPKGKSSKKAPIEEPEIFSHEGHRERLRKQFNERGLEGLPDYMILEMILCFAVPRKDVNPIARRLVNKFGSLAGVLEASKEQLESVPGVGTSISVLIRLFPSVNRLYMIEKQSISTKDRMNTPEIVGKFFYAQLYGSPVERLYGAFLDSDMHLLLCKELTSGDAVSSSISIRNMAEIAVNLNATGLILGHNHPGGQALPSVADVASTKEIQKALSALGITLHDHIIVAGTDYISMGECGYLRNNDFR